MPRFNIYVGPWQNIQLAATIKEEKEEEAAYIAWEMSRMMYPDRSDIAFYAVLEREDLRLLEV